MSEIQHPSVDLGIIRNVSLERTLAEEAFRIVMAHGCETYTWLEDVRYSLPTTEPVDLSTEDDDEVSFRIKAMPVLNIDKSPFPPSADYFVMELQHGRFDMKLADTAEDPYNWQPYIRMIVNTEECDDVTILDARTFQELEDNDLAQVNFLLTVMQQEYRGMQMEDEIGDAAGTICAGSVFTTKLGNRTLKAYNSIDFFDLSSCDKCSTDNQACKHNPYTLQ
ncbi:MAG: hypothetical protein WC498_04095 [Candidatus Saccharimonadales bacterium]